MKTSLSSFVYFNYRLEDAIRHTAAAGYASIDIWGGRPHAYRRDLSQEEIAELRELLRASHLAVASFIPAQFRYPTCLCSNNETIRRDSVAYIQDAIETAAALGAPIVSVCPGHTVDRQGNADGWQRLADSLDTLCKFAASRDIRLAIEPADRYETDLIQTTAAAIRMIDLLGHPNLGVVLDNGHAFVVNESCADAIQKLGSRLFHVHIDDNNGVRDQHLVPGDGSFDFAPFIAALRQAGYAGYLCAELSWDYTVDPDDAARRTHERLDQLLRK
jgi:sugar phosphate isomerase/epimerase